MDSTQPLIRRQFGAGDVLSIIGIALSIIVLILFLSQGFEDLLPRRSTGLLTTSLVILLLTSVFTGVAVALSFNRDEWLYVPYLWSAVVALACIAPVTTVSVPAQFVRPGGDFMLLLGALLVGGGAYLSHHRIGIWSAKPAGEGDGLQRSLEQLHRMRQENLIDDEEHRRKRESLLERL